MRDKTDLDESHSITACTNTTSMLDDIVGNDLLSKCSSQPSILKELNTLRIKSNRGRPRRQQPNKEN